MVWGDVPLDPELSGCFPFCPLSKRSTALFCRERVGFLEVVL